MLAKLSPKIFSRNSLAPRSIIWGVTPYLKEEDEPNRQNNC